VYVAVYDLVAKKFAALARRHDLAGAETLPLRSRRCPVPRLSSCGHSRDARTLPRGRGINADLQSRRRPRGNPGHGGWAGPFQGDIPGRDARPPELDRLQTPPRWALPQEGTSRHVPKGCRRLADWAGDDRRERSERGGDRLAPGSTVGTDQRIGFLRPLRGVSSAASEGNMPSDHLHRASEHRVAQARERYTRAVRAAADRIETILGWR
jgi:hypothetical protein